MRRSEQGPGGTSNKAKGGRGADAVGLTRVMMTLLTFGALLVVARLLTSQNFGQTAIGTTVLGGVIAVIELSVGSALVQSKDVDRDVIDSLWALGLMRTKVILLGLVAAAWPLSWAYGHHRLVGIFIAVGAGGAAAGKIDPRRIEAL